MIKKRKQHQARLILHERGNVEDERTSFKTWVEVESAAKLGLQKLKYVSIFKEGNRKEIVVSRRDKKKDERMCF